MVITWLCQGSKHDVSIIRTRFIVGECEEVTIFCPLEILSKYFFQVTNKFNSKCILLIIYALFSHLVELSNHLICEFLISIFVLFFLRNRHKNSKSTTWQIKLYRFDLFIEFFWNNLNHISFLKVSYLDLCDFSLVDLVLQNSGKPISFITTKQLHCINQLIDALPLYFIEAWYLE